MDTDNLGPVFGKLFAISAFGFVLAQVTLVLMALRSPGSIDELTGTDLPVLFLVGSYFGAGVSLLCYSGWSFWQVRQMRTERSWRGHNIPLTSVIYILWVLTADSNELTTYETRLKRAIFTGIITVVLLVVVPLTTVYGTNPRAE